MSIIQPNSVIIGGGAAGLFAAALAAQKGIRVTLLEKNEQLGRKLLITGKGRCNVTNNCSVDEVRKNIPRNAHFLYSALAEFAPQDTIRFFESNGCPLKTERGNRVFPQSDRSADILHTLTGYLKSVERQKATALKLFTKDGAIAGVKTDRGVISCSRVLLATGGASYPLTGSTGDGYRLAADLGHTICPISGSLVPMVSPDDCCREMQGLSLRNTRLQLLDGKGKVLFSDFGELLFTHFGVSGPLALSASAHWKEGSVHTLRLDLKPALDETALDARFLRDFDRYANRCMENALADLYPHSMIPVMLRRAGIAPECKANALTRAQRRALLEQTKRFDIPLSGLRPVEEAIVTRGGVNVKEIDPKTMQSRLVKGLYFAGEILDCDAYTGGFNLQIAWSTAFAAISAWSE